MRSSVGEVGDGGSDEFRACVMGEGVVGEIMVTYECLSSGLLASSS